MSAVPIPSGRFVTQSGIDVEICCQDLLADAVDAVVCSVGSDLNLGGGAAKAVAKAAGGQLRQACQDFIRDNGQLQMTNVMHAPSGRLMPSIRFVILVAGPVRRYYPNQASFESALTDSFYNCFMHANNVLQIDSIAVPAIGAGK
jgi:O-acetyl-ADP-ribose deacetylase (regulator of RNase III)